ncbi:Uncharacterized protein HZ326_0222 [Fusarium oxysporum f. sp. albedinis]|nr:Uncharacterized protein HZ326_0222 [Fusarium oxysporum f. sp. albedinis]
MFDSAGLALRELVCSAAAPGSDRVRSDSGIGRPWLACQWMECDDQPLPALHLTQPLAHPSTPLFCTYTPALSSVGWDRVVGTMVSWD